ncbi:unnamed protein product [Staurois parvus]|uniref:Uncharacterized protein n=1 Tax=Staurois parvus TaxID=386267 RepID=A0ABN9DWQ8_9NEOB|nr:unnamed protein product [Staurois parvus]
MYINGQTGAVQGRVAVYKLPPHFPACACSLGEHSTMIQCLLYLEDTAEH